MAKYYKKAAHSSRPRTWQYSAKFTAILFVVTVLIIPSIFSGNIFLKLIGGLIKNLGLIASLAFAFFTFLTYRKSTTATVADSPLPTSDSEWRRPPYTPQQSKDSVDVEWGRANEPTYKENKPEKPIAWTLEVLRSIEWKRFEELAAAYFRAKGLRAETQLCGADGGIDVWLYTPSTETVMGIVQCKTWNSRLVGVKPVREFLGVMAHEKVERGFFMASGEFSSDAKAFAESHKITLITGERFLSMLLLQPPEVQQSLLAVATEGDYQTPTCASCGIKMIKRESKRGGFWGCSNYPRCKSKFAIS